MRMLTLAAVVAASLGAAGTARAQGGINEHDGFFLQMDLGLGAMKSKASAGAVDQEVSGTPAEFSLALGGAVAPNFIVAGQLWGASINKPTLKQNGAELSYTGDVTETLSCIGVNLTYYFMPYNVYVSATPSIGGLTLDVDGTKFETKNGFAFRLAAGKEFWVSDNWGLGFNVQYAHASNKDEGTNPPTWATNWFGLAFSATYN